MTFERRSEGRPRHNGFIRPTLDERAFPLVDAESMLDIGHLARTLARALRRAALLRLPGETSRAHRRESRLRASRPRAGAAGARAAPRRPVPDSPAVLSLEPRRERGCCTSPRAPPVSRRERPSRRAPEVEAGHQIVHWMRDVGREEAGTKTLAGGRASSRRTTSLGRPRRLELHGGGHGVSVASRRRRPGRRSQVFRDLRRAVGRSDVGGEPLRVSSSRVDV